MAKPNIKFISSGFQAIVQSDGCRQVVEQTAQEICDRANGNNSRGGEGFSKEVKLWNTYGKSRYVGFVSTTDKNSMIAESEDSALTRAIT